MIDEAYRAECRRRAREQFDREYGGSEASSSIYPGEPSPSDTYGIEARARREWESSPALREEFGGRYEAWLAFSKAEAKGLVRIISRKT